MWKYIECRDEGLNGREKDDDEEIKEIDEDSRFYNIKNWLGIITAEARKGARKYFSRGRGGLLL